MFLKKHTCWRLTCLGPLWGAFSLGCMLENCGGMIEMAHMGGDHYVAVGAKGLEPLGNGVVSAPEEDKAAAILESIVKWNDTKLEASQA